MSKRLNTNKIENLINENGWQGLLCVGAENSQYLTNAFLPFARGRRDQMIAVLWSKSGEVTAFVPSEWISSYKAVAEGCSVVPYNTGQNAQAALAKVLTGSIPAGEVGSDLENASVAFVCELSEATSLIDASREMEALRSVKSDYEKELLTKVAYRTDHAINGCIHHITVDRRMSELTMVEELRIHSIERDIDLVGYDSVARVSAGPEINNIWNNEPRYGYAARRDLVKNETVRMEILNNCDGYWSNSARMMVMHEFLSDDQQDSYDALVSVRELLIKHIKPGIKCSEVAKKVFEEAGKAAVNLSKDFDLGHSIGVSPVEGPYINLSDDTVIEKDMVLVLDPVIDTAEGGTYRSKDTIIVEENGAKIVNWYKDWREPYTPIMSI